MRYDTPVFLQCTICHRLDDDIAHEGQPCRRRHWWTLWLVTCPGWLRGIYSLPAHPIRRCSIPRLEEKLA